MKKKHDGKKRLQTLNKKRCQQYAAECNAYHVWHAAVQERFNNKHQITAVISKASLF